MTGNAEKLVKAIQEDSIQAINSIGMSMADMFEAIEELIQSGVIEEPYSGVYSSKGCVVME